MMTNLCIKTALIHFEIRVSAKSVTERRLFWGCQAIVEDSLSKMWRSCRSLAIMSRSLVSGSALGLSGSNSWR